MKTYHELLGEYREAQAQANEARAEFEIHLPAEGVRLTTRPDMRAAYEQVVAATEREMAARKALLDYRGD